MSNNNADRDSADTLLVHWTTDFSNKCHWVCKFYVNGLKKYFDVQTEVIGAKETTDTL